MQPMAAWPLVGRDEELALFRRLLVDEGRGVVVVAPAGTGKTRLVQETVRRASDAAATEFVVATRSAQSLPLAAVAALLPAQTPAASEPLDLFRAVRRTLGERAGGRPTVVAIDDAHLLDPLSAALLQHLAVSDGVRLLVAVRKGEPVEDAITALWRDGIAERVDLQPLGPDDVAALLRAVLEGRVDAATAWRLWSAAGGNPLYLREVVTEAVRVGTLSATDGVWRWQGDVHVGARLRELVELRLATLHDDERAIVALLAVGEVVPRDVVERACALPALTALERRGFVVRPSNAAGHELALDHPLFAEVVRSSMAGSERRRWCEYLASSIDPATGDDVELLHRAVWQLDAGIATDGDALARAADRALKRFDGALAERLGRAALDAGAGDDARLTLAEATLLRGKYEETLLHARVLEDAELSDAQQARVAMLLAEAGFWGLGRIADAEAALERIAARVVSTAARQRVDALQSAMMLAAGRLPAASELGLSIAADDHADPQARLRAVTAAAAGLSLHGHPDEALQLCERLLPVAFTQGAGVTRGVGWVIAQSLTALVFLGRFREAEQLLAPVREAAIVEGDDEVVSSSSVVLGRLALSYGDLHGATAMLRDATAALRTYDPAGYRPWALGLTAQVAAQLGDVATAQAAITELDAGTWHVRLHDYESAMGRAWAASAAGEMTAPVTILLAAVDDAHAIGSRYTEGLLLHEALRLGAPARDVVDRLDATRAGAVLPLHDLFHAHARALVDDDGSALDAVAASFEQVELFLYAAEVAAEAVTAHRRAGRNAAATRSAATAARLKARCPGARTPALALLLPVADLTRREREVCQLAARGLSNNTIAERLVLNVRTVEGHLLRAMTKLGVNSRQELERVLGGSEIA
jgi:DNA-binding NarL/FixJ family response regulator